MPDNQLIKVEDTFIDKVLEQYTGEVQQRTFTPDIVWKDVETWRMNAVGPLIDEMTEAYSSKFGKPANIIDIGPDSIKGCKFFFGRIIIFEEAQLIVVIDRIEHIIIPFGSFLGFSPIDMSKTSFSSGEIESNLSISPVLGAGLLGSLSEGLTEGALIGGASIGREYTQKPVRVHTKEDYALSIKTKSLKDTEIIIYFNEDAIALEKFCDVLNIILDNESYRQNTSPIIKKDFNLANAFYTLYSEEIDRLYKKHEEKIAKSKKDFEERVANNSGCMVTLFITVVTTLSLCFALI